MLRRLAAIAGLAILASMPGCRSQPGAGDVALGRELALEIRRKRAQVRDPGIRAYVTTLVRELLEATGPHPVSYRIFVIDDPSANAFALPGGYLFVHTGLLLAASSSPELAAGLAHEIGHVALRHGVEAKDQAWVLEYRRQAALARSAAHGVAAPIVAKSQSATNPAYAPLRMSAFSRDRELEADRFAVRALHAIGMCGLALEGLLGTITRDPKDPLPPLLTRHPPFPERRVAIEEEVDALGTCSPPEPADDDPLVEIQEQLQTRLGCRAKREAGGADGCR